MSACLWLGALWYAAPLFHRKPYTLVDRLRTVLVLGTAIPFGLAFLALLWAPLLWAIAGALVVARIFRNPQSGMLPPSRTLLLVYAGVLLIAWPAIVRPPLDGDTLLYHLPNAFTWAQHHSIWQTNISEWYYPGGSEVFASAFFSIGAAFDVPLCGLLAALLLAGRITLWGKQFGTPAWVAAPSALAFIWTPLAAFQAGTMQNDLWLAAFLLEALYATANSDAGAYAMSSLLKPIGWVFGLIAAAANRAWDPRMLLAAVPLALWLIRDIILLPHAVVSADPRQPYWSSTIADNLTIAGPALFSGIREAGIATALWLVLPFFGLLDGRTRKIAIAGVAAVFLFAFLPFSYQSTGINYLASGSSLRFALPAMAVGAVVFCALGARAPVVAALISVGLATAGVTTVLGIFWNDTLTRRAFPVAAAFALITLLPDRFRKVTLMLAIIIAVVYGGSIADRRSLGFYADWMRSPAGVSTGVFSWLSQVRPKRIATWTVRPGAVAMVSPTTELLDVHGADPCAFARAHHSWLLVGTDRDLTTAEHNRRFSVARECGTVIYADGAALVIVPR